MKLSGEDDRRLADIASRHGLSRDAVDHLFSAVLAGHGNQAQFNHPELGGMGQWSLGGMTMVGDMFNGNLKARVADVCAELSIVAGSLQQVQAEAASHQSQYQGDGTGGFTPMGSSGSGNWWPDDLGYASSTGAQNEMRYAVFPASHRLAISIDGDVKVYDTGDHRIGGFSQQQGGNQSITFTSQHGPVQISDLRQVDLQQAPASQSPEPTPTVTAEPVENPPAPATSEKPSSAFEGDIFTKIERLAELHAKGILHDEEFQAKKRELLDRL
jgi:hypothetical protein